MLDVLFYDDEADEDNSEIRELVSVVYSVMGSAARVTVLSSAIDAREWIRNRPQARMPAVLILDIKNEDRNTRLSITPLPPDKHENSGLTLAKLAYQKWPSVRILYLTRLDYAGPASDEADKFHKVHQWVEKKGHGTAMRLHDKLRAWFQEKPVVQVGRLTLNTRELTIYYHHVPMRLGTNVKRKGAGMVDSVYLTPELYNFLSTMMIRTDEKRDEADCTITIEELRGDENTEDGAIHARKHELCNRLRKAEALIQKVNAAEVQFNCADVIVNTIGGYLMVER